MAFPEQTPTTTIIPAGGTMVHGTTEAIGPPLSTSTVNTGGSRTAVSDATSLLTSFPGMTALPTAVEIGNMKAKLLQNTITDDDIADASGYYGFPTPAVETPEDYSSADLVYTAAPDLTTVTTASPYMPNLVPPELFDIGPDNTTTNVLTKTTVPQNPSATSVKTYTP